MNGALFSTALALLAFGIAWDLVLGAGHRLARPVPYVAALAASACLAALGARASGGRQAPTPLHFVGLHASSLAFDRLSGFFLTALFSLAVAVSASFASWVFRGEHRRSTAPGYGLLLGSVAVILVAADAFVFLFAWEMLTVSFYLLTSGAARCGSEEHAPWLTAALGKLSGAALLLGFLLLAGKSGSLALTSWHSVGPGAVEDAAWVLLVVGFGAKLGMVPFQIWLPVGYPAAPGPARAAMAGVAANVGVYGLWRFVGVLGRPQAWLALSVLVVGGVTALLGVAFACVQGRLNRFVAYSSVENAGLILAAYGVGLAGAASGSRTVEAVGLLAATLQVLTHAIAKSALFVASANISTAMGTDDLEALRGTGRELPWSGATFGAGALALAGLPPTAGFVSEWFILEALMQQYRLHSLALRLALALTGALVALTAGLAVFAFVRVLGLSVLGRPSRLPAQPVKGAGFFGRAGMVALALACLGTGAVAPWELRFIGLGLSPLVPERSVLAALKSPWVLQPVFPGFSILSPSWLWVVMPLMFLAVFASAMALSRGRYLRVRRAPAWHSATVGVAGPAEYTPAGFAGPLRHVLANVLGTRHGVSSVAEVGEDAEGGAHIVATAEAVEPVEAYLYRPLLWVALRASGLARCLQSGRLAAYVAYMLLALMALLALVAAMK
jgi:hydrogenase-4 component B